jgi:hypothetical protein
MDTRYEDTFRTLEGFNNPSLVVCPKCNHMAVVSIEDSKEPGRFSPRVLTCQHCAHRDRWSSNALTSQWRNEAKDDYFNLPLWLQIPCGENFLFAYNEEHLEFLESYVGAKHRTRNKSDEYGWSNQSAASRLPKWIKSKKNRPKIIKALSKLREKFENI